MEMTSQAAACFSRSSASMGLSVGHSIAEGCLHSALAAFRRSMSLTYRVFIFSWNRVGSAKSYPVDQVPSPNYYGNCYKFTKGYSTTILGNTSDPTAPNAAIPASSKALHTPIVSSFNIHF